MTGASDPTSDPLRQALHQATRQAHHRIDHHPLMAPLVQGSLSAADYARALVALAALHHPIETVFRRFHPALHDSLARRSRDLAADLDCLATPPAPAALWWDGRPPSCLSDYVGMRYVIEGSSLGGAGDRRATAAAPAPRLPPGHVLLRPPSRA
jgi:heme oxygenase